MATLTLDQKRLEQLRTQLYGKPSEHKAGKNTKNKSEINEKVSTVKPGANREVVGYIKQDLTKVVTLSTLILILQFAVYYALANKWLTINFYGISY